MPSYNDIEFQPRKRERGISWSFFHQSVSPNMANNMAVNTFPGSIGPQYSRNSDIPPNLAAFTDSRVVFSNVMWAYLLRFLFPRSGNHSGWHSWVGKSRRQSSALNFERRRVAIMQLSLSRYRCMLLVQNAFLLTDLLINTFCEYLRFESVILLVIFV